MLKFLTHKLRTHSLNEENGSEKVEERDSGTESDDEAERAGTGEWPRYLYLPFPCLAVLDFSRGPCASTTGCSTRRDC
ncbi:unnamed protein product, partial [Iphiclides podalirius]